MKKFLIQILEWMEDEKTTMSDVFIRFPDGKEITYGVFWDQVTEGKEYGGRCLDVYNQIEEIMK